MQSHPEFNAPYIIENIINKIHDLGKIDDTQAQEFIDVLTSGEMQLNRHLTLKIAYHFLKGS